MVLYKVRIITIGRKDSDLVQFVMRPGTAESRDLESERLGFHLGQTRAHSLILYHLQPPWVIYVPPATIQGLSLPYPRYKWSPQGHL